MRRALDIMALLLLAGAWALTAWAVLGPQPLPPRIPTHFDAAGQPNGWGVPAMLWLMPGLATVIYGLMTWVARHPAAFNFPVRMTAAARPRLENIALNMIAWLKAEVIGLFAVIQQQTIQFARQGRGTLSPLFLPGVLVLVFAIIAWHVRAMRAAAGGR